ncbi:unnamed protein product [Prorocentrum cordatum]|uniref:TerD domain-containing protein n=1 Tax=Prorocentrum cordatum TaxID=2364126 RepID=A0ABN9S6C5_9DINO|nr:unnamed protein product [Polarella glacialis]
MEKLHDLDLQAVIVNREGIIVDTVYYNNLTSMKGSITHSGDVSNGASEGVDESVWISLAHVPEEIWGAIFVVCAFSKGSRLKDVQNGRVVLMEGTTLNRLQVFNIERSVANADVVGLVKRTREGGWAFKEIDEPAEFGSHFVDIIEPWIGDVIRAEIPTAPAFQKISFVMDKGSVATFPADAVLKRIFVGIGGSLSPSQVEEVDIDAEAVFCDSDGHVIGAVDGENHSLFGVEHSGDSVVGHESMGDDEAITIDLAKIPSKVARIFIVLTVFNGTFELVEKAYARVLDQHSSQLVRFDIQAHEAYGGLLVAQLIRSDGAENRWGFQGLGKFFTCTAGWKSGASEIISKRGRHGKDSQRASLNNKLGAHVRLDPGRIR